MDRDQLVTFVAVFFALLFLQFQFDRTFMFLCHARLHNINLQLNLLLLERQRRRRNRRNHPYRWALPRPAESWFEINWNHCRIPGSYFKSQLRMDRDTFDSLLDVIRPWITRQDTQFRNCIPPEKILACGLYRLAHGNSYVTIGANFGMGKSTVIEAVQDVVEALYELRNVYIKFPESEAETRACIQVFSEISDLPNVVGAIDCSHIDIKAPIESAVDYFSRYQRYDFIIQGVVDGKKRFIDFVAGFPGSLHDARVLRNSRLYIRAENREILNNPLLNIGNNAIRPYLVGDSAYPLGDWIQKPYPEATRNFDEINFNKELSSARVNIECAFGILKSRWRILSKKFESDIDFAAKNAVACAVLHNFCIMNGDHWDDDYDDDGDDDDDNNAVMNDGDDIRAILTDYLK